MNKVVVLAPVRAPATLRTRLSVLTASLVAPALIGLASAQTTTTTTGAQAVTGLSFDKMIQVLGDAIKTVIADNGYLLVVAIVPILAFYFIWNRVRGLF